ncbi:MAG: hypothetical protein K9J12_11965 [Melioribacteraceae bacterium]|nr:hypothetical protein [Melioribacteraceae bacterium]MCF8262885.1 hypothetical protein [Melioribacteraceae bacterium]MCF8430887.1 hypothetical protein [Melioribacteraceae bacterium]
MDTPIVVESPILSEDGLRLDCTIHYDANSYNIYFESDSIRLNPNMESILSLLLLPAMVLKKQIETTETVSESFHSNLQNIQSIYRQWFIHQQLQEFSITNLPIRKNEQQKGKRIATFFSGGVDAFYTLIKNNSILTDIVFIRGFDIHQSNKYMLEKSSELIAKAGREFDKNVITIDTNARLFIDKFITYGKSHGAILASVSHLLTNEIGMFFIPSTDPYGALVPYGSHPLLDPMWSSDRIKIIHDGCESTRLEKLKVISKNEFALNNLRVCFAKKENQKEFNCCTCEKCVRTMIGLHALGVLEKCKSFKKPLDLKNIYKIDVTPNKKAGYSTLLYELEKFPGNEKICSAISKIMNKPHFLKSNFLLLKNSMQKYKYRFPKFYRLLIKRTIDRD